jgi:hypothetical protein
MGGRRGRNTARPGRTGPSGRAGLAERTVGSPTLLTDGGRRHRSKSEPIRVGRKVGAMEGHPPSKPIELEPEIL